MMANDPVFDNNQLYCMTCQKVAIGYIHFVATVKLDMIQ